VINNFPNAAIYASVAAASGNVIADNTPAPT
jgi:hypothetical protein